MRWIEKTIDTFYNCHDVLYQHAKFGGDRTTRAAVGAKIGVFLYRTLGLPARRGHSSNKYCVRVYGSILMQFSAFFSEWIVLADALHSSHFRCQVAPQFSRNCGQKLRKVKNRRKSLCAPLCIDN